MRPSVRKGLAGAALALVVGGAGAIAIAQIAPEAGFAYRKALMASQGGHSGAIRSVVRGETPFTAHVLVHANAIAGTTAVIPEAFEGGSVVGDSRAKPEIWTNWDDFVAKAQAANEAANALVAAAETGDLAQIQAAFGPLGQACGACHDTYRTE